MRLLVLLLSAGSLLFVRAADPAADPVHQAPLHQGYEALREGRYEDALDHFVEAGETLPRDASIRKELGYLHLKLGDPAAARDWFHKAHELDPKNHHTTLQLAYALLQTGEAAEARRLLERVKRHGAGKEKKAAADALAELRREGRAGAGDAAFKNADAALNRAYEVMRAKNYQGAIHYLREAVEAAPARTAIRKELAYVYLKIGETEWAREVFEQVVTLDSTDERAALELSFLDHETGHRAEALERFRALRRSRDSAVRREAEVAVERIETELGAAIARWSAAAAQDPRNESVQRELGRLYEDFGDNARAAEHYEAAWRVQPPRREELLGKLARARGKAGAAAGAAGAWLLASYSNDTRISETARERLPKRFPWASEFLEALRLDEANTKVRRDLAYLFLEVGQREAARQQFERVVRIDPDDLQAAAQLAFLYLERRNAAAAVSLLERARESEDEDTARRAREALKRVRSARARPHRELGEKSLQHSYLRDAQSAFLRAYEADPEDYTTAFKLGVVHNLLRRDREAMRWFRRASESPDDELAAQARESYQNLAPQFRRVTTTLWTYPMFSTRYQDLFNYAQLKTEFRLGAVPIRPYLSLRFVGDLKQRTGGPRPEFLSESSLIAGVGLRTIPRRGVTFWAEAGEAISYLDRRAPGVPRVIPDYRGGVNWFRGLGANLTPGRRGAFLETNFDGVYVSRFEDNLIGYWQLRPGYRLPDRGRLRAQVFWNFNVTTDRNRAYWANFGETGPGIRFRLPGVSPPMNLDIHFLRGVHLVNEFNPRRPNYYDLRVSLWYSFAR